MSLWTIIFGEKPEWRLCKQLDTKYMITYTALASYPPKKPTKGCVMTYFLYEDQNGNRRFEMIDSESGPEHDYAYRCKLFRNTIKPWLDGRIQPEIPSYESIPCQDFKRILSNKK